MYWLETEVTIKDRVYPIRNRGDFRMILDCFEALSDTELKPEERIYVAMIIFYEDFEGLDSLITYKNDLQQLQLEMIKFFCCGEDPENSNTNHFKVLDWQKDSNLICSAINNVAKQEVRALDYLHWWTFLGYYNAIGECPLSNIVGIRYKIARGEKLEKYEKKFRQDNPEYFRMDYRSEEQREADEYVRRLWGET